MRKQLISKIYLSLILSWLIFGLPAAVYAVNFRGQNFILSSAGSKQNSRIKFKKPPSRGLPAKREAGGTRRYGSSCFTPGTTLTLLLPEDGFGLTTSAYPRFFWYVPANTAQRVEFSLYRVNRKTQAKQLVYKQSLQPTQEAKVESIELPKNRQVSPLKINQLYQWSVTVFCTQQNDGSEVSRTVEGWLERITLPQNIVRKLQTLSPKNRLAVYAERGLWFDLLSTLAQLHYCRPSDVSLSNMTADIFEQVELSELTQSFTTTKLNSLSTKHFCINH
ncbi:DUF928 domain-containing protein [Brunnivagina elsteri]|uniref:DUF928 domain-containing protein n=1 Tax=Brunnivagina elsteri TaxID=1247191 RepID=UPI001B801AC3|nr:DUF928 domain-containing protein [Calothrix elsteri]